MSHKIENEHTAVSMITLNEDTRKIKSKLEGFTLIEQEEESIYVKTFLIQEIGTVLKIMDDTGKIVYTYNNRFFDTDDIQVMINNHIKKDHQIHLLKMSNKYKNLIGKIEAIINKKIPNDLNNQIRIHLKNKEKLSFNIGNLRRFIIDGGESDIYTDYFDYTHLTSQKQMFEYLQTIYQKGEK